MGKNIIILGDDGKYEDGALPDSLDFEGIKLFNVQQDSILRLELHPVLKYLNNHPFVRLHFLTTYPSGDSVKPYSISEKKEIINNEEKRNDLIGNILDEYLNDNHFIYDYHQIDFESSIENMNTNSSSSLCEKWIEMKLNKSGPFSFVLLLEITPNFPKSYIPSNSLKLEKMTNKESLSGILRCLTMNKTINSKDYIILSYSHILVQPKLKVGKKNVPIESLSAITVIPKLLNKNIDKWEDQLSVVSPIDRHSSSSNFNTIHFTPIQPLSPSSHSAYSLTDLLSVNNQFRTKDDESVDYESMANYLKKWRKKCGTRKLFYMSDIVLNHLANESEYLKNNPNFGYNLENSFHLIPAFLLDRLLFYGNFYLKKVSEKQSNFAEIKFDRLSEISPIIQLISNIIHSFQFHQFFQIDKNEMKENIGSRQVKKMDLHQLWRELKMKNEKNFDRYNLKFSEETMEELFSSINFHEMLSIEEFVDRVNDQIRSYIEHDIINRKIIHSLNRSLAYETTKSENRLTKLSINHPLFPSYFHVVDQHLIMKENEKDDEKIDFESISAKELVELIKKRVKSEEKMLKDDEKFPLRCMAHNGWVMSADNKNFALPSKNILDLNVYFRRELISWTDSVKLNFGMENDQPLKEANVSLLRYAINYVLITSAMFDVIRLDNCHSTPIRLARLLMKAARLANPNLVVVAELFTSDGRIDRKYSNLIGINCLIRENMQCHTLNDLQDSTYVYSTSAKSIDNNSYVGSGSGVPMGTLLPISDVFNYKDESAFNFLLPTNPVAMFMDQTHDNKSLWKQRSLKDTLSTAAIISFNNCSIGSTFGVDLFLKNISVVFEKNPYPTADEISIDRMTMNEYRGRLNDLHSHFATNGFSQMFVDKQYSWYDVTVITRCRQTTHSLEKFILFVRSAFHSSDDFNDEINVNGKIDCVIEGKLESFEHVQMVLEDNYELRNVDGKLSGYDGIHIKKTKKLENFCEKSENKFIIKVDQLKKGEIIICHVIESNQDKEKKEKLFTLVRIVQKGIDQRLRFTHLKNLLFNCREETTDDLDIFKILPSIKYSGYTNILQQLFNITKFNTLDARISKELRNRDRIFKHLMTKRDNVDRVELNEQIDILQTTYRQIIRKSLQHFSQNELTIDSRIQLQIFLATLQFLQYTPVEKSNKLLWDDGTNRMYPNLAAGLPHFACGLFRMWGRDILISVPGTIIELGRLDEAKRIIIAFARTFKYNGLMPNLLGDGVKGRYNCRDTVWWFTRAIRLLIGKMEKKDIISLLSTKILLLHENSKEILLSELLYEILVGHLQTIHFREDRAGNKIDQNLLPYGFFIEAGIDEETSFVYGGNEWNAGTWMDKVGDRYDKIIHQVSDEDPNYHVDQADYENIKEGRPATSRHGSAIELVGLQISFIKWIIRMVEDDLLEYHLIKIKSKNSYRFRKDDLENEEKFYESKISNGENDQYICLKKWNEILKENFQQHFFVDEKKNTFFINRFLVNKTGIFKDTYGCWPEYCDYQLRPNQIAMIVSVLDDDEYYWKRMKSIDIDESIELLNLFQKELPLNLEVLMNCLKIIQKELMGPLGIRTLVKNDYKYSPNYDKDHFSYHNGPEWLWLAGLYYVALIKVSFYNSIQKMKELQNDSSMTKEKLLEESFVSYHEATLEFRQHLSRFEVYLNRSTLAFCSQSERDQLLMTIRDYPYLDENTKNQINRNWYNGEWLIETKTDSWMSLPELTNSNGQWCYGSCPAQCWSIACFIEAIFVLNRFEKRFQKLNNSTTS
ncbi:hypothetical protein SNEBB_008086 [Seison nebaliae]|nr:hypothetical protein SNEBB_008086 [Seison nebaliae]